MNPSLFEATFHNLIGAIETGYGKVAFDRPDFEFTRKLQNSAKYFAARKTILQTIQLTSLAIDEEKGTSRPFGEFRKLSKGIIGNYNKDWLKTEYTTAVMSARSARDWQDYVANQDIYPNLEYLRTVSPNPRESHLRYVGIIRSINDSFWKTHYPPLDWVCSCGVKSTDAKVTAVPEDIDTTDPVTPALQNNPAQTGQLFNVMASSYGEKTAEIPDATIAKELRVHILPKMNFYIPAYQNKNGGSLEIHPAVDEAEFKENTSLGFILAKNNYKVKVEPKRFVENQKEPDLKVNEEPTEIKNISTENAFNSAIKRANKQEVSTVVVTHNPDVITRQKLTKAIAESLSNQEKHKNIKKVIIHYEGTNELVELQRNETIHRDKIYQKLK